MTARTKAVGWPVVIHVTEPATAAVAVAQTLLRVPAIAIVVLHVGEGEPNMVAAFEAYEADVRMTKRELDEREALWLLGLENFERVGI